MFLSDNSFLALAIPQELPGSKCHPGGQLTAANGLVDYLKEHQINYRVLNTIATVYPPVSLRKKFLQSINRVLIACYWACSGKCTGLLAFSGFGLSLYERCVIALVYRLFNIPSAIFFRSSDILVRSIPQYELTVLKFVLKFPSIIFSQSQSLASFLKSFKCKKIYLIRNWLPKGCQISSKPKLAPVDKVVRFIFVGWLEPSKGLYDLIDAVHRLDSYSSLFQVTIAGNGSLQNELISSFDRKTSANINYVGWVDRHKLYELYNKSHVFLLPSHSEGFPNSLLEAMSFGLPAITTRVGGIPDSIKNDINGFLISPRDPYSLALSMLKYIETPSLITAHSKEALSLVKSQHDRIQNLSLLLSLILKADA